MYARRPAARSGLSRRAIVSAALKVVRAEGLGAVSMRRLAADLGTAPMSLYRHVTDREDVLIGMLDEIAASVWLPARVEDPVTEVVEVMDAIHSVLVADPWVVDLLVMENLGSARILPAVDRAFDALFRAGVDPLRATQIYNALAHYTFGEVLANYHEGGPDSPAGQIFYSQRSRFPALSRLPESPPPDASGPTFGENLSAFLRGLLAQR